MKRFFSSSVVAVAAIAGLAILVAPGCGTEEPVDLGQLGKAPAIAKGSAALTGPACVPTGAHAKHGAYACSVCHTVGGSLCFDLNGPAKIAGGPDPSFDFAAKTCSNIACHGVPSGTYSYYFPGNEDNDGDGYPDPELKTVTIRGNPAGTTPSWYVTGPAGCAACHPNPPTNGTDGSNNWHSGFHANRTNVGPTPANACELCHNIPTNVNIPIALSAPDSNGYYRAYSINSAGAAYHSNGTFNISARFRSQCFGCH